MDIVYLLFIFFMIISGLIAVLIVTSNKIYGSMNYPVDKILNRILKHKLNAGIKKITSDDYYIYIQFNDNTNACMWNVNKYYSWLSKGSIVGYTWDGCRPTRRTMWRLNKAINKYYDKILQGL